MKRTLLSIATLALLASTQTFAAPPKDDAAYCPPEQSPATVVAPTVAPRLNAFVHSARTGDIDALKKALDEGVAINVFDNLDQTALIAAVSQSKLDAVKLLVKRGADVNLVDRAGWSPLHFAVYFSTDTAVIDALIAGGAKLNAQNDRGITPLYFASITGHELQVKRLIAAGADRNLASKSGYTPLRVAQIKGLQGTAALLSPAVQKDKPSAARVRTP